MMLLVPCKLANGQSKELEFLVDTGSEVNLIKSELVPDTCLVQANKKLNLFTASDTPLVGGEKHFLTQLKLWAIPVGGE